MPSGTGHTHSLDTQLHDCLHTHYTPLHSTRTSIVFIKEWIVVLSLLEWIRYYVFCVNGTLFLNIKRSYDTRRERYGAITCERANSETGKCSGCVLYASDGVIHSVHLRSLQQAPLSPAR